MTIWWHCLLMKGGPVLTMTAVSQSIGCVLREGRGRGQVVGCECGQQCGNLIRLLDSIIRFYYQILLLDSIIGFYYQILLLDSMSLYVLATYPQVVFYVKDVDVVKWSDVNVINNAIPRYPDTNFVSVAKYLGWTVVGYR